MPKVKTLWAVRHDGKDVRPGTTLDVPGETAEALVASGAAERVKEPAKGKKEK